MTELTERPQRRTGLRNWLIVTQLLAAASLILSFYIMIGYGMADQGQGLPPQYWIALCYPIFPLTMCISAWMAFARRKNILAAVLSGLSLSLVPILIFVLKNLYA